MQILILTDGTPTESDDHLLSTVERKPCLKIHLLTLIFWVRTGIQKCHWFYQAYVVYLRLTGSGLKSLISILSTAYYSCYVARKCFNSKLMRFSSSYLERAGRPNYNVEIPFLQLLSCLQFTMSFTNMYLASLFCSFSKMGSVRLTGL